MGGDERAQVPGRVLGIRSDAPPLRGVAVELGDGVTALYGRNGAGKSRILAALRDALTGRASPGTHIITDIPDADMVWLVGDPLGESVHYRIDNSPREAIRRWFSAGGRGYTPRADEFEISETLIEELARSRHLALVPTGTTEARWDVWICTPMDLSTAPETAAALERFEQIVLVGRPLMGALVAGYDSDSLNPDDVVRLAKRFLAEVADRPAARNTVELEEAVADWESGEFTADEWRSEHAENVSYWGLASAATYLLNFPIASWLWDREPVIDGMAGAWAYCEQLSRMAGDGLPIPVARIDQIDRIPWVLQDETEDEDVDAFSARRFSVGIQRGESLAFSLDRTMYDWLTAVSAEASEILSSLLQDGPELRLELAPPHEWFTSPPLSWKSLSLGDPLPIAALSTAESRWARIAIRRALDRVPVPSLHEDEATGSPDYWGWLHQRYWPARLILIDEPEAALHRAAERHMAVGLDGLTVAGPQVVVATHSPEILNRPEVSLIHVHRRRGGLTSTSQMPKFDMEESYAELGMLPSDLIGMYRIFLLVEGEHDEIVVRALLPDVIESSRVKIVAMRGGAKLPSTVESQLLFDMTTAHVVALLDNVAASEIDATWLEAQERYLSGDADLAIDYLTGQMRGRKGEEYQWISQWLARALKKGVGERLLPYGLAARDIIEYLPAEAIVPKARKSWVELRAEHDAARPGLDRSKGLHDFKTWLTRTYAADVSPQAIRAAAATVTDIPIEFQKLGYRLREVASRRP